MRSGLRGTGARKQRIEIPPSIAAEVLFLSDRTCCVCRQRGRPIQIHHIDDDPTNNLQENLAVLCTDCHNDTLLRGGFDRKLDAAQIRLYKTDWNARVEVKRTREQAPSREQQDHREQTLRYLQLREESDEYLYSFEADYVLVGSSDVSADVQANSRINGLITKRLRNFKSTSMANFAEKEEMKQRGFPPIHRDSLSITHNVRLFCDRLLSVEFQLTSYGAGAAHPNTRTETLNFQLHPFVELELDALFIESIDYLNILSDYCIEDLHKQRAQRYPDLQLEQEIADATVNSWIVSGTVPKAENFQRFNLQRYGILIHFDPYQVDCYAAGKYEVFVPNYRLRHALRPEIQLLLAQL